MDRIADGYRFRYTRGAEQLPDFRPLAGFPDLFQVYESADLFPHFSNRLLQPKRSEYAAYLSWSGFDPANPPEPLAILGVTEGQRVTDQLEVFPCPAPDPSGRYRAKFFVHGLRHREQAAQEAADALCPGGAVILRPEPDNPRDAQAVALDTVTGLHLGYAPRYLAADIATLQQRCGVDDVAVTVQRVNRDAPQQMRLLCQLTACWPSEFRPCGGDSFQPLEGLSATA